MSSVQSGESLSFVWWNTSLAPPGDRQVTQEQQDIVGHVVLPSFAERGVDFIALGEVSSNEKEFLSKFALSLGYDLLDGFTSVGRSKFDMLFLYNSNRLIVEGPTSITAQKGGRTFRIAQRIDITVSNAQSVIHLFVSHWPSRLLMQKDHPDRHLLGVRLGDSVQEIFRLYNNIPNVILLGDYNDEPFDNSLTEGLLSTRDRKLAKRRKHLLYNPFWRYLGASCHNSEEESIVLGGSYYHKGGETTQWRLFDQMIFSTSFLGGGEWMLDETLTQLLDIPDYSQLLDDSTEYFDHAPILGVIRRI